MWWTDVTGKIFDPFQTRVSHLECKHTVQVDYDCFVALNASFTHEISIIVTNHSQCLVSLYQCPTVSALSFSICSCAHSVIRFKCRGTNTDAHWNVEQCGRWLCGTEVIHLCFNDNLQNITHTCTRARTHTLEGEKLHSWLRAQTQVHWEPLPTNHLSPVFTVVSSSCLPSFFFFFFYHHRCGRCLHVCRIFLLHFLGLYAAVEAVISRLLLFCFPLFNCIILHISPLLVLTLCFWVLLPSHVFLLLFLCVSALCVSLCIWSK